MKIDPYKHKERYISWRDSLDKIDLGVSKTNSKIFLDYMFDMEHGINVASGSVKGSRSYSRLNNLKQRILFLIKRFEERYNLEDVTKISERELHDFFTGMRNGTIKRLDGREYKSAVDYIKIFKAFWHWHEKVNRKQGIKILDITVDLDIRKSKPEWVYLDEKQVREFWNNATYDYKVLVMFLYDTGIRAPTELMNIRVSDFYNNFKELNIRDEVSKTFGRRIKLMICSDTVKEYVEAKKLDSEDYLFTKTPSGMNRYLKRLSTKLFGEKNSPAGEKYSNLSLYDFRHCSCCYWLPRYKSESALKFRFGWKKSDKIHYYSEMLGMRDTISEEDLLVDVTKTEIENRLRQSEGEKEVLKERIDILEGQMKKIMGLVDEGRLVMG